MIELQITANDFQLELYVDGYESSRLRHTSYTQKLWMRVKRKAAYLPG
jgi:hypothetical protein